MSTEKWHSDIDVTTKLARDCIERQFTEIGALQEIKCIGEGWDNKVFLVNQKIIFRFPRRKVAVQLIERENSVLKNIKSRFFLQIPEPQYIGIPSENYPYPFHGYILISGLSGSHANLSLSDRIESIKPLALFLKNLHSFTENEAIEIGAISQVFDRTEIDKLVITLKERVAKIIERKIAEVDENCFQEEINIIKKNNLIITQKTLVHGDLYSRHLIFNQGKLSGIIDWGDTGINHHSVDLSVIYSFYPQSCHDIFFSLYGPVDEKTLIQARFLGLYSAITLLLYAYDTDDDLLRKEAQESILRINPHLLKKKTIMR